MAVIATVISVTPMGSKTKIEVRFMEGATELETNTYNYGRFAGQMAEKDRIRDRCIELDAQISRQDGVVDTQVDDTFTAGSFPFRSTVEAEIASRIAADQIFRGTILEIDEDRDFAIVSVYLEDPPASTTYVNRQYLAYLDNVAAFQFRQITQQ